MSDIQWFRSPRTKVARCLERFLTTGHVPDRLFFLRRFFLTIGGFRVAPRIVGQRKDQGWMYILHTQTLRTARLVPQSLLGIWDGPQTPADRATSISGAKRVVLSSLRRRAPSGLGHQGLPTDAVAPAEVLSLRPPAGR